MIVLHKNQPSLHNKTVYEELCMLLGHFPDMELNITHAPPLQSGVRI